MDSHNKNPISETEQEFGFLLSGVEIGLGSILHSLHLPLSGQFLSLNQIFLLSLACKKCRSRWSGLKISIYAAIMKIGLAQGKRITPMIAIGMQGWLFSLGGIINTYLGASLSSLWAFLQPLAFFYMISSGSLPKIIEFYQSIGQKFSINLYGVFFVLISLKLFLALLVCYWAKHLSDTKFKRYRQLAHKVQKWQPKKKKSWWQDFLSPFYMVTLTLFAIFFWYNSRPQFGILIIRTIGLMLCGIICSRFLYKLSQKYIPTSNGKGEVNSIK